jgi:hypothetical protein
MRGIAEQQKIQLVSGPEALQQFQGIGAGANDDGIALFKFCFCVTKLGRFDRSTGCVRFGKKEDQDALPLEVVQRDILAFVGFHSKFRGLVADFKHKVLAPIRIKVCAMCR